MPTPASAAAFHTLLTAIARRPKIANAPNVALDTPFLPKSLEEALIALRQDRCLASGLGKGFIDYFLRIKQGEYFGIVLAALRD